MYFYIYPTHFFMNISIVYLDYIKCSIFDLPNVDLRITSEIEQLYNLGDIYAVFSQVVNMARGYMIF